MDTHDMNKKILVVAARGFEEVELTAPVDILRRLGAQVCVAGVGSFEVVGAHGLVLTADRPLDDVVEQGWDGIVIPGGPAAWELKQNVVILQLVQSLHAQGKLVAAICAAPMVLAAAGILRERRITCYPAPDVLQTVAASLVTAEEQVVRDDNIITGRGPAAALDFGYALGEYLAGSEKVVQLRREMCCKV